MRPRTKKRPSGNRLQEGHIYIEAYEQHLKRFLRGMKYDTKPATCKWLSDETYVLPPVVNIVYTMTFESERFKAPLDLVRFAQFMPNTKYRPPNFAAITIRLWPTTALLYMVGKMTLIRATTRSQALFFSHLNRQIIEQVPILMKNMDDPEGKPYIGTLEGYLDCSIGEVQNMVGSGVLPQNGVHLTRLLYSKDEAVDWDPGGFPNLIYRFNAKRFKGFLNLTLWLCHRDYLSDGTLFCANIAITGKIVLMGLKTVEGLYESYKMMCKVLHDFDDPNAPSDPKERHKYRMRQLEQDPRFLKETEAKPEEHADYVENIGVERGDAGVEALGGDIDDGDQVVRMFTDDFANKEIGPRLRIKIEEGKCALLFKLPLLTYKRWTRRCK